MRLPGKRTQVWLLTLVIIVAVPLAGKWLRRRSEPHCEFDGVAIEPLYRVRIVDRIGTSHQFCCVRCAEQWLARQAGPPAKILVTDEGSGMEIDSELAIFVQSDVITQPVMGNTVHVFRDRATAVEHAQAFHGSVLKGSDRPLQLDADSP